jgi:hypothetical protein
LPQIPEMTKQSESKIGAALMEAHGRTFSSELGIKYALFALTTR